MAYTGMLIDRIAMTSGLQVELLISSRSVRLITAHEALGTWGIGEVAIARIGGDEFQLDLGDEQVIFRANDVLNLAYEGIPALSEWKSHRHSLRSLAGRLERRSARSNESKQKANGHAVSAASPADSVVKAPVDRVLPLNGATVSFPGVVIPLGGRVSPITWLVSKQARNAHAAVLTTVVLLILIAIPRIGPEQLGPLGLASELSWPAYLGFAGLAIGFAVAAVRHPSRWLLASYVGGVAVLLHGLGSLAYEFPRYSWAWKHAGIVDYIMRHNAVDPSLDSLRAYHNWPGFFGFSALVTEGGGLESPLSFAAWAPIFFNLCYLAALYLLYRSFIVDERLIWTALMLFTIGNWIGQDYFAPQASAYLFYLLVAGILLNWFPKVIAISQSPSSQVVLHASLLILITAIVISHQLTPVMTILATAALLVAGRTRLKWPPIVTAVLMVLWLVTFARPFIEDYWPRIWADLQGIAARVETGLIDHGQVDVSQRYVSTATRALSAVLVLIAVLGYLRSFRTGIRWLAGLILAATPGMLIVASSYGNEVLFRTLLFALPVLTVLGAALWFSREPVGKSWLTQVTLSAVLLVMIPLSIIAQHGNDIRTVFGAGEVRIAGLMYEIAPEGSAVIQLSNDYPTKFTNYEHLAELTIGDYSDRAKDRVMSNPAATFAAWGRDGGYTETYVLMTRSQAASVARLGTLPADAFAIINRSLGTSERFELLSANSDGALYRLIQPDQPRSTSTR